MAAKKEPKKEVIEAFYCRVDTGPLVQCENYDAAVAHGTKVLTDGDGESFTITKRFELPVSEDAEEGVSEDAEEGAE